MAGRLNFSKGQGIGEYAIIIGVIISAIIAMQVYVQRGLQARYKAFTDSLTSSISSPTQYEPYYTRSDFTVEQNAQSREWQFRTFIERDTSAGSASSGKRSTEPGCAEGAEGCPAFCGDVTCDEGENSENCLRDCPICWPAGHACGGTKLDRCCSGLCGITWEGTRECS